MTVDRAPSRGRPIALVALLALLGTMGMGAVWAADAGRDGLERRDGPERRDGHAAAPTGPRDTLRGTVVLLHGLGRTHRSMRPMEASLEAAGYRVVNLGYPSREHTVSALADTLAAALERCCADADGPVHFVTHSLGGIVVRQFLATHAFHRLGRVVMLSPPNQGSEIIDRIPPELLERVLGPAAVALATDSTGVPARLPPAAFELGVITGDASINPLFSWWLPGEDDGKVSVESAWVAGTDDFLVVPYTHAFIMRRDQVMRQVLAFLRTGEFLPDPPMDDDSARAPAGLAPEPALPR